MKRSLFCVAVAIGVTCASCGPQTDKRASAPQSAAAAIAPRWEAGLAKSETFWGKRHVEFGGVVAAGKGKLAATTREGWLGVVAAKDGSVIWEFSLSEPFMAPPTVRDDVVYAGNSDGNLYAFDLATGERLWFFESGSPIEGGVEVHDTLVYVSNASNRLYALDRTTGEVQWRGEREKVNDLTMLGHGTPTVAGDRVYAGFSDGTLMVYEAVSGKLVWGRDISRAKKRFKDVDARPIVSENGVYAASFSGGVYRLGLEDGSPVWDNPIVDVTGMTLTKSAVIVSSPEGVRALSQETGEVLWHFEIDDNRAVSAPVVNGGLVVVAAQRDGLIGLSLRTGEPIFVFDTGPGFSSQPVVDRGALFALSNRSMLHAFDISGVK